MDEPAVRLPDEAAGDVTALAEAGVPVVAGGGSEDPPPRGGRPTSQ